NVEEDVDDDVVYYRTIIYSLINKEIFTEDYIRDARESILFGRTIFEDLMNYNSSLLHSTSYPYISILVERFIKEFESRVDFVVSKGDIEGEVFKRTLNNDMVARESHYITYLECLRYKYITEDVLQVPLALIDLGGNLMRIIKKINRKDEKIIKIAKSNSVIGFRR